MFATSSFSGPGLGIRILGDITSEKVKILQEADKIFIDLLKEHKLYNKVWQAELYSYQLNQSALWEMKNIWKYNALRAVESTDGMTADWVRLPYDFVRVSNKIINRVKGVNRVVYDVGSKHSNNWMGIIRFFYTCYIINFIICSD